MSLLTRRPKFWLHLGIQNFYEKKGFAHCVEEGRFTDEYRVYNGGRAGPLFVRNVDNESQGAVSPFCRRTEQGWEPAWHSSALVRHGNLASFPSWVFLRRWSYWTPGENMVWFLVICILFEERLQGKWKPFPRKASRITTFPQPPFKFDIRRTLYVPCQTLRQLKSQEGAVFVLIPPSVSTLPVGTVRDTWVFAIGPACLRLLLFFLKRLFWVFTLKALPLTSVWGPWWLRWQAFLVPRKNLHPNWNRVGNCLFPGLRLPGI